MKSKKCKILCIQLKQIGDVLMTTPAIKALAKARPQLEIHFLTLSPSHQIFEHSPYIFRIILATEKKGIKVFLNLNRTIKNEKYDVIIDFFGQPKTALLAWLSGAKRRIGFHFKGRSIFYTDKISLPEASSYAAIHKSSLLKPLNINVEETQIEFHLGEEDHIRAKEILKYLKCDDTKPLISVSPVSRRDYKVWPPERFAQVCDQLISKYQAQILFIWGPGEEHFIKAVREQMREKDLGDYPIPSIRETAALFKLVDLHFGNDNGPMHFAIASKTITVSIFGRPKVVNWSPPKHPKHLAFEYDPGCKNNCVYPKCQLECLKGISQEKVYNAILSLLFISTRSIEK